MRGVDEVVRKRLAHVVSNFVHHLRIQSEVTITEYDIPEGEEIEASRRGRLHNRNRNRLHLLVIFDLLVFSAFYRLRAAN